MKISAEDKRFILENLECGAELLQAQDIRRIIIELNVLELKEGFDRYEDGPNEFGRKMERIMDRLYYDNRA